MPRTRADSPTPATADPSGGAWALPLLALGIGVIALCSIIPATDDNRLLVFERERLKSELLGLEQQVELNAEFLDRIHRDRDLALRLASRQRAALEQDVAVLAPTRPALPGGGGLGNFAMSPFALVAAAPAPQPIAPVPPAGGRLAELCRHPRARLGLLGCGLLACMFGVLGGSGRPRSSRPG